MKTLYKLLSMGVALLTTSCIYDSSFDTPDLDQNDFDEITLHLNITAGKTLSRAPGHDPFPTEHDESFINIEGHDYKIYILDGNTDIIIKEFEPTSIEKTNVGNYKLSGEFPYDENLKSIKILVLANWTTDFTASYPTNLTNGSTNLPSLYANTTDYNFTYPLGTTSMSWFPYAPSGIPMFGLSEIVSIPEKIKNIPGLNPELEIPAIPMLRALAKIVVEDKTEDEAVSIRSCKLTKFNKNGRFIPDGQSNPDWSNENVQVIEPSLPQETEQSTDIMFRQSDNKTFMVYVPEMEINFNEIPCIEVEVYVGSEIKTYEIKLGEYGKNGTYLPGTCYDILRNHRYKYNILSISNGFKVSFGLDDNIHLDDPDYWDGWYEGSNN